LIPCAIDQDPYFRITRDIAHKIVPTNHPLKGKPALLHSKFFPPLEGALGKMSSSNENSAVFLTDSPDAIAEKIKTHAFSGGQATKALQEEKGADLEVDVAYQWLSFFLDDDEELAAIGDSYSRGQGAYWSTGLVKDKLVDVVQKIVAVHQARRATITNEEVLEWMATRRLV
jgi:tryptophanyl-tRNA synthetase